MIDTVVYKSPRWMKFLLIASLAVNLLIAGAIGGSLFFNPMRNFAGNGPHGELAQPAAMQFAGRMLIWKLPRKRRAVIFQLVRKHRLSMQPALNQLAVARLNLAQVLRNNSDDRAVHDQAFEKIQQAERNLQAQAAILVRKFVSVLTPPERRLFGEILMKPPGPAWRGRGKHGPPFQRPHE